MVKIIDVRQESSLVESILFADTHTKYGAPKASFLHLHYPDEEDRYVYLWSEGDMRMAVETKADAENMIKALQLAITMKWFDE